MSDDGVDRRRKTPPRLRPPASVPAPRQVYAHLHGGFDVSCPDCGRMHQIAAHKWLNNGRRLQTRRGYDQATGVLTCRGCDRRWYVGVVLWPVAGEKLPRLPEDHVPGVREVQQLARGWAAGAAAERGGSGRRIVNAIGPEVDEGEMEE